MSIAYAEVATHNHFVLDRGGKVFKQTAPVIKLAAGTTVDAHLELVGVLNSSTACFWMKQACHGKGNGGIGGGIGDEKWEPRYAFDATKLQQLPLPRGSTLTYGRLLDELAQQLAVSRPGSIAESAAPTADRLSVAHEGYDVVCARMIAVHEELDWHVYKLYELIDEPLTCSIDDVPPLALGERAFEIVLARRVEAGDEETSWFARHGSMPITELPAHWPDGYRRLVERRIELIEADRNIGLIEKPEHKRRWNTDSWAKQQERALRTWLLDRLEAKTLWAQPQLRSCAQLADIVARDAEFVSVAGLYANEASADLTKLVSELVANEAVAYAAALRYTDDGMRKHAEWLHTWELQRAEDGGEALGSIPVPPKYTNKDFRPGCWEHRGKLDVPKERFVSYPLAERATDPTLVIGWAGWDHVGRARALASWYVAAKNEGRDVDYRVPLLAGLAELVPWLKQWHNDPSPDPMLDRPGDQIAALVESEVRAMGKTTADLDEWRPPAKTKKARSR